MNQNALIKQILAEIKARKARVAQLGHIEKENVKLHKEDAVIREKLTKLEKPKNSNNSSIPPSKHANRPLRTKCLRKPSGKKVDGQNGHQGSMLKMTESRDLIVDHVPDSCVQCGRGLYDSQREFKRNRQVVDIPIPQPIYTEHRNYI